MNSTWKSVVTLPPLGPNELQVWKVTLPAILKPDDRYTRHLSADELNRATRLRPGQVRLQFVVARTCLRILVGNILGLAPKDVPITLSPYGKPQTPALHFNVAHSRDTILIALSCGSRVGVDLEYLDRDTEISDIARTSFTEHECRAIETGGPAHRRRAFFNCWTRKEAVIKADGRGLSVPLNSFEVSVCTNAQFSPVHLVDGGTWFVSDVSVGEEIAAAVAIELPDLQRHQFSFPMTAIDDADIAPAASRFDPPTSG